METKAKEPIVDRRRPGSGGRGMGPNPLWSKAPLVLFRYPGNLASVVLGAILLTIAAGLFPLFLSRTTSDLVTSGIDDPTLTRYGAGIVYRFDQMALGARSPDGSEPLSDAIDERFADLMSESPVLDTPVVGAAAAATQITAADGTTGSFAARLFTGEGFRQHIRPVGPSGGSGVWLPDFLKSDLKVESGDMVTIGQPGSEIDVRVAGYYRGLYALPRTPYWHPWNDQIYPQQCPATSCSPPTQFVIADRSEFPRLARATGSERADFRWAAPIAPGLQLTLDQAHALERFERDAERRVSSGPLQPTFHCCVTPLFPSPVLTAISTGIPSVITDVDRRVATVQGPGELLEVAGLLVALVVIVVAGIAAGAARRTELELLFVEGTGPGLVGAKTATETVLPCIAGGAAGLGLAVLLSHVMASGGPIAGSALATSAERTALAVMAAVVLLAAVAVVSFIRRTEHHRARLAVLAKLPWEIVLLALAFLAYRRIQVHGAFTRDVVLNVVRPSFAVLVFPILFIAGFATLAARVVTGGLLWLRERSGGLPSWMYLGVHRLAGGGRLTVLMIAASALCLGIFVQGQTLVRSLEDTVDAKAQVFVGSDVSGKIDYRAPVPRTFPMPLTRVTKASEAGELEPSGESFDLLAVDPRTIASAAYWNPGFSGTSIQDMADALGDPTPDALPVVLVAGGEADSVGALHIGSDTLPVDVVATSEAFPGMVSQRPLVVASEEVFSDTIDAFSDPLGSPTSSTELWVKGDPGAARRALAALRFAPYPVLSAKQVEDIPYIAAVIDTFLVLNLLGIAAALLVVAGVLAFLQARQRSQLVSYGLSLRMGMTHTRHRRSMVFELAFVLLSALVAGVIIAGIGASLSVRHLDPFPQIPPPPLFVRPVAEIGLAAIALAVAAWVGAWFANRRAKATDFGEVMRLAE